MTALVPPPPHTIKKSFWFLNPVACSVWVAIAVYSISIANASDINGNQSAGILDLTGWNMEGASAYGWLYYKSDDIKTLENGKVYGSNFTVSDTLDTEYVGAYLGPTDDAKGDFVVKNNSVAFSDIEHAKLQYLWGAFVSGQFQTKDKYSVNVSENKVSLEDSKFIRLTHAVGGYVGLRSVNAPPSGDGVIVQDNNVFINKVTDLEFYNTSSTVAVWGIRGGELYFLENASWMSAVVGSQDKGNSVSIDQSSISFSTSAALYAWIAGASVYITSRGGTDPTGGARTISLSDNAVSLTTSDIKGDVSIYGAALRTDNAFTSNTTYTAKENQLVIGDSIVAVNGLIAGGMIDFCNSRTLQSPTIEVVDNALILTDSTLTVSSDIVVAGMAYANEVNTGSKRVYTQAADVSVERNSLAATGVEIAASVYGGYAQSQGGVNKMNVWDRDKEQSSDYVHKNDQFGATGYNSGDAVASENQVTFNKGANEKRSSVSSSIYGGYAVSHALAGRFINNTTDNPENFVFSSGDATADNNQVTLSAVTVTGDIYGGYARSQADRAAEGEYHDNDAKAGNAQTNGNQITISDSSVEGAIYGGFVESRGFTLSSDTGAVNGMLTANDNRITLGIGNELTKAHLYGSNLKATQSQGNILEVNGFTGTIGSVSNFNRLTFTKLMWDTDNAALSVAGGSLVPTGVGIENGVTIIGVLPHDGAQMTVIDDVVGNLGLKEDNISSKTVDVFGDSTAIKATADVSITQDGDMILTVKNSGGTGGIDPEPQTHLLAENRAVAVAFIDQTQDLIPDALNAVESNQRGHQTFALMEGVAVKYDVNTDLKINGWYGLFGAGSNSPCQNGSLAYSLFFEMGTGNYRTHNTFNREHFRGDGKIEHYGLGFALRYRHAYGIYGEAGLRGGILRTQMNHALKNIHNTYFDVNSDSYYWNIQLALGNEIHLTNKDSLDVYARYYHTYNEAEDYSVGIDNFKADSIVSDKMRVGVRYARDSNVGLRGYVGAGWEYEFNGDVRMSVDGMFIPTQSTSGSTGFGELGVNWLAQNIPVELEARLKSYVGQRQGTAGMIRVTYSF